MSRNPSLIRISLLKLLKHYKILKNKNKINVYLTHHLDRVSYKQWYHEDVYLWRLYVALLIYTSLQNTNEWKIVIRYPNTNLKKARFNYSYFLLVTPLHKLWYSQHSWTPPPLLKGGLWRSENSATWGGMKFFARKRA